MKILKNNKKAVILYSKLSEREIGLLKESMNLILPGKKVLTFNDLIQFEKVKETLLPIKEKYNLSLDELLSFAKNLIFFPITIFNKNLTVLESVVKYLKEERHLPLRNIADYLKKDQRNIWHTYNKTKKKYSKNFIIKKSKFWIPLSIFSKTKLSPLETMVVHLHDKLHLKFSQIARLLKRDQRTIWTVNQRARKKHAK